ncbi:MAG: anti-sigma factor [Candidatus Binatia bacterium]
MMTCEFFQEELVAYRDGELPEQEREQIAVHLKTCAECAHEEIQLTRVEHLLATMERMTPSPNFVATFWKRLEQEQTQASTHLLSIAPVQEHPLVRWWRELRESMEAWQVAPALAAVASLLVFFAYFFTIPSTQTPTETPPPMLTLAPQELAVVSTKTASPGVPADLTGRLALYTNYNIISDLEQFSHLEEIAAVKLPTENITEIVKEDDIPPELLQNPSFFAHYPILERMDKLQNLESVLGTPATEEDPHSRG